MAAVVTITQARVEGVSGTSSAARVVLTGASVEGATVGSAARVILTGAVVEGVPSTYAAGLWQRSGGVWVTRTPNVRTGGAWA